MILEGEPEMAGEKTPAENQPLDNENPEAIPSPEELKEAWRQKEHWQKKFSTLEETVRNVIKEEKPQEQVNPVDYANTEEEKIWRDRWLEFVVDNPSFPRELKDSLIAYAKGKATSLVQASQDQLFKTALEAQRLQVVRENVIPSPSSRSHQLDNIPIRKLLETKEGRDKVSENWDKIWEGFENKGERYI